MEPLTDKQAQIVFPEYISLANLHFLSKRTETNSQHLHKAHSQVSRPLHNHLRLWREIFRSRIELKAAIPPADQRSQNQPEVTVHRSYYHPFPDIIGLNNVLSTVISIQNYWMYIRNKRAGQGSRSVKTGSVWVWTRHHHIRETVLTPKGVAITEEVKASQLLECKLI